MLYPIGIQSFEDIRRGGYVYVDKTALIYKLAATGKYYFLSRPRRFGKSLLISTMEAYFKGRKELFDGLAIASLEKDWTEYPVLHLDLSGVAYNQEEVIAKVLSNALCKWEKEYGSENNSDIPGIRFGFLNFLLGYYAPTQSDSTNTLISLMSMDVESGNPEGFMTRLDALFARTNYQIQGDCEKDFQYAMYIIIELMGEYVETERTTSNGRIDILIKTKDYVYIIEIKTDSTPDEALAQIEEKGYARPFADDPRRVFRIGVNFSTANRRIDGWKII